MTRDPARLLSPQSEGDEFVRSLFAQGEQDVATPAELEAVAGRLAPVMGGPGGAGTDPSLVTSGGTGGGALLKVVLAGVVAAAGVGALLLLQPGPTTPEASPPAATPPAAVAPAPADDTPTVSVDELELVLDADVATADPQGAMRKRAPGAAAEPEPEAETEETEQPDQSASDRTSESRLLLRARAALETDPARSLRLTAEHRQRFPGGVLSQEREVIAIDALARLGRRDEARERSGKFRSRYPDSAHKDRVEETTK